MTDERIFYEVRATWVDPGLASRAERVRLEAWRELHMDGPAPRIRWFSYSAGDAIYWPAEETFRGQRDLGGLFHAARDRESIFINVDRSPFQIYETIRHELKHASDFYLYGAVKLMPRDELETRADAFAAATSG